VKYFEIPKTQRFIGLVALTAMGRPLFNAPDGGYYEIVRVTGDSTQSEFKQGPETSVLVEQKVRAEAFPSGLPMSAWLKFYALSGLSGLDI
jgi:hypothetical protein